jgi:26S proteasome regulatory subunit N8
MTIELLNASVPNLVVVHPIVLLSVVDHYNRIARDTKKRVVGVLLGIAYISLILGEYNKGVLDVSNCYAVPFEEELNDPKIWFLDHIYHETMYNMFKKVRISYLIYSD